jgi:hypothetical protein
MSGKLICAPGFICVLPLGMEWWKIARLEVLNQAATDSGSEM